MVAENGFKLSLNGIKKMKHEEHGESVAFHDWLILMKIPHHYSPHGEERIKKIIYVKGKSIKFCPAGARLKRLGASAGFPDFSIFVPNQYYHGLFIEMKKLTGGKISDEQQEWIAVLSSMNYYATACNGFKEAKELTDIYLKDVKKLSWIYGVN